MHGNESAWTRACWWFICYDDVCRFSELLGMVAFIFPSIGRRKNEKTQKVNDMYWRLNWSGDGAAPDLSSEIIACVGRPAPLFATKPRPAWCSLIYCPKMLVFMPWSNHQLARRPATSRRQHEGHNAEGILHALCFQKYKESSSRDTMYVDDAASDFS